MISAAIPKFTKQPVLLIAITIMVSLQSCNLFERFSNDIDESAYIKYTEVFHQAGIQRMLGNTTAAHNLYQQAAEIHPKSAAAHYYSALFFYNDGEYDTALFYIEKATNIEPNHLWYNFLYASTLRRLGEFKKSERIYKNIISLHPKSSFLHRDLIDLFLQQAKYEQAIEAFKNLVRTGMSDEEYALLIYRNISNKPDLALDYLNYLSGVFDDPVRFDMLRAELYILQNRIPDAEQIYKKYYDSNSSNPAVLVTIYNYFYYTVKKEIAHELEKRIIESDADVDTKLQVLSVQQKNDSDSYRHSLMKLYSQYPKNPAINLLVADIHKEKNEFSKAYESYKIAFSERKSDFQLTYNLLEAAAQLCRYDELSVYADTALLYMPNHAEIYFYKTKAYIYKNDISEAQQYFDIGSSLVFDKSTEMLFDYAEALLKYADSEYLKARDILSDISHSTDYYHHHSKALLLLTNQKLADSIKNVSDEIEFLKPHLPICFYHRARIINLLNLGLIEDAEHYADSLRSDENLLPDKLHIFDINNLITNPVP